VLIPAQEFSMAYILFNVNRYHIDNTTVYIYYIEITTLNIYKDKQYWILLQDENSKNIGILLGNT